MAHNYWDYNSIGDGLEKCGPFMDCAIGTQGKYTSLNAAIAAGHTRIIILPGATITAGLNISADNVSIRGFMNSLGSVVDLGSYKIAVDGDNVYLSGFQINGTSLTGIEIRGENAKIENITVIDAGATAGLYLNSTAGNHSVIGCTFRDNDAAGTIDGIRMTAAAGQYTRVIGCDCGSNGQYGINDASDDAIMVGNNCVGNGTSGINSSSTFVAANAT